MCWQWRTNPREAAWCNAQNPASITPSTSPTRSCWRSASKAAAKPLTAKVLNIFPFSCIGMSKSAKSGWYTISRATCGSSSLTASWSRIFNANGSSPCPSSFRNCSKVILGCRNTCTSTLSLDIWRNGLASSSKMAVPHKSLCSSRGIPIFSSKISLASETAVPEWSCTAWLSPAMLRKVTSNASVDSAMVGSPTNPRMDSAMEAMAANVLSSCISPQKKRPRPKTCYYQVAMFLLGWLWRFVSVGWYYHSPRSTEWHLPSFVWLTNSILEQHSGWKNGLLLQHLTTCTFQTVQLASTLMWSIWFLHSTYMNTLTSYTINTYIHVYCRCKPSSILTIVYYRPVSASLAATVSTQLLNLGTLTANQQSCPQWKEKHGNSDVDIYNHAPTRVILELKYRHTNGTNISTA